jgi:metal transporter CNNM
MSQGLTWIGILLCISQSAVLSGSNLAFYRLSRLRLEAEAGSDPRARRVLALRRDSNFLLATILWGNVAVNVLLALLANSVLVGVLAFLFSTVVITWFGEIMPQAYFSRHPLKTAAALAPVIRFYRLLLFPVARPTGLFLDWWLGQEAVEYMREPLLRDILKAHLHREGSEVGEVEGIGALNFLDIDDMTTLEEGEDIAPESILRMPMTAGRVAFPTVQRRADDPFLQALNRTLHTWAILVDDAGEPALALNVNEFTRAALYGQGPFDPYRYCHRPIVVRDRVTTLGQVIARLKARRVAEGAPPDAVIENDVVLIWLGRRRIITGSDILGRLLTGIGSAVHS